MKGKNGKEKMRKSEGANRKGRERQDIIEMNGWKDHGMEKMREKEMGRDGENKESIRNRKQERKRI